MCRLDKIAIEKKDYDAGNDKLEKMKGTMKREGEYIAKKKAEERRKVKRFDDSLIKEAAEYVDKIKDRINSDKSGETLRQQLATIYRKMLDEHPDVTKKKFPFLTYGTNENSETAKKAFPDKFKIYFFRIVKSIGTIKRGKGAKTHVNAGRVRNKCKKMPPMFLIGGGKGKCTIHEFGCPSEECPYITHNKKIVMCKTMGNPSIKNPESWNHRLWFREDKKSSISNVFMTQSDTINCTFEPKTSALKPYNPKTGN